ncbi:hypothetical protein CKA32_005786 [Geitlerinema sp. FC II]|nr:hypothetical protein CKA32_005786 [Geitlerinema sp. FC II]
MLSATDRELKCFGETVGNTDGEAISPFLDYVFFTIGEIRYISSEL